MNFIHPRMVCAMLSWNFPSSSREDKSLRQPSIIDNKNFAQKCLQFRWAKKVLIEFGDGVICYRNKINGFPNNLRLNNSKIYWHVLKFRFSWSGSGEEDALKEDSIYALFTFIQLACSIPKLTFTSWTWAYRLSNYSKPSILSPR